MILNKLEYKHKLVEVEHNNGEEDDDKELLCDLLLKVVCNRMEKTIHNR